MSNKIRIGLYYIKFLCRKFNNREQLQKYQQRKIKHHLKFVSKHSKFYKNYKNKNLNEFPIINKKIMMENFNLLNTIKVDKEEALDFAINSEKKREFKSKLNGITVGLSSGTSDVRGVFLVSDNEKDKWAGYILAKYIGKDIFKGCKVAFFMRADSNLYESLNSKKIQFKFFDIFKPIKENLEILGKFKPDILVGQPSVLLEIANNQLNNSESDNTKIFPKKIISIAEVLEKKDEEYIKKAFNQKLIHQVYQCTEGCLATTCKYGKIHLNEDIVYIEKEYIDKHRFIPIVTDFTRKSQPIIRYRLNDILVESEEKCECGLPFTIIDKIEGREDDIFIFEGTKEKEIKVYPDFIRRCILFAGDINNYRCVQKDKHELIIYIDTNNDMEKSIYKEFEKLSKQLEFKLPNIKFEKYFYDKRKKLKRIESLVK